MIASANRLRSAGWLLLLGVCFALVLVLAFHVNALRSRVLHAEERIVALKQALADVNGIGTVTKGDAQRLDHA